MWQSNEMKQALAESDPIKRLIAVFELLHSFPLSDSRHGEVDCPALIEAAKAALTSGEGVQP